MGRYLGVNARRVCVILDTNMLMLLHRGIDVFNSIEETIEARVEFIIPQPVIEELEKLASRGTPSERRAAANALRIIGEKKASIISIPRPTGTVDLDIALYARTRGCLVATNDKELRRTLRRLGVPEIHLRESEGILEASFKPPYL